MKEVILNWLEDAGRWKNCMDGCDEHHRHGCATCPDANLNSYELVMQAIDIMQDYIKKEDDGTKTVVKVQKGEYKEIYNDIFRKWCPKKEIPKVDDFNSTVEEMFEDLFADDFECESCKIDV